MKETQITLEMNLKKFLLLLPLFAISIFSSGQTAIQFDGSGDYILIPKNDSHILSEFTISAWVRWEGGTSGSDRAIISNYSGGGSNHHYGLKMLSDGRVQAFADDGSSFYTITSTTNIKEDAWHFVAISFKSGAFMRVFVDGELEGENLSNINEINPSNDLYIGRDGASQSASQWIGKIDNVAIWDYAMPESYLSEWKNVQFSGEESGMVAYWTFDEGIGNSTENLVTSQMDALYGDASFVSSDLIFESSPTQPKIEVAETGLPYNVVVTNVTVNGTSVQNGTYIQLYDNGTCVGSGVFRYDNCLLVTWEGDDSRSLPGFQTGNPIQAKVITQWYSEVEEFDAELTFVQGNGNFGSGTFSVVSINAVTNKEPGLVFNKQLINFNSVVIGTSKTDTVIMTNSGTTTLQIENISIPHSNFTLSKTSSKIRSGESDTLIVTYSPSVVTEHNIPIIFTTDHIGNEVKNVNVHALALPSPTTSLFVTPKEINLGNGLLGSTLEGSFYVINKGNADLQISNIFTNCPNASITGSTSFTLSQNEFREVPFSVTVLSQGGNSCSVYIESSETTQSVRFNYTGIENYFSPVQPTGKPYTIIMESLNIEGRQSSTDDQIGIFDGEQCVGAGIINQHGIGLEFDGSGDYAVTPNMRSMFNSESVTLELWFNALGAGVILSENGNTSPSSGWYDSQIEILSSGEVRVRVWNFSYISLGTVEFGTWNHVAVRYNEANQTLSGFLNGVISPTERVGNRECPWESGYNIYYQLAAGQSTNMGSGVYFTGQIDEFRVWSIARSDYEISSKMSSTLAVNEFGLAGYWDLNNSSLLSEVNGYSLSLSGNTSLVNNICPVGFSQAVFTVWEKDENLGYAGYTAGNTIDYKIKTTVYDNEVVLNGTADYIEGDGTFGFGAFSVVNLSADFGLSPHIRTSTRKLLVGQIQSGDTIENSLYVYNDGTAPLFISLGENSSVFSIDTSSATIQPGDSLKVNVLFSSSVIGNNTGVLIIVSDDPNQPQVNVVLEGFVLPVGVPNIDVSVYGINFSSETVGDTSILSFNIINIGTAPLEISNVFSSSSSFLVNFTPIILENTNDNIQVDVVFKPTYKGQHSGRITIQSNAETKYVQLSGTATDGHFTSVPSSGLPYFIIVENSNLANYIQPGDEIAVFDGDTCVGKSEFSFKGNSLHAANLGDVLVVPQISLPSNYNIEAWVKFPLPSNTNDYHTLCRYGSNRHHVVISNDNYLGLYNYGFYSCGYNTSSLVGWHHISAVGTGSETIFYIDGEIAGTSSNKLDAAVREIGNYEGGNQQIGFVDEFRVWNSARSQANIRSTMNLVLSGNEDGLLRNYSFDNEDQLQGATLLRGANISGEPAIVYESNIQIVAWQRDNSKGFAGFVPGNPITFKVWGSINNYPSEFGATANFTVGDGTFGYGQFSVVDLNFNVPNIEVIPRSIFKALDEPDSATFSVAVVNTGYGVLEFDVSEVVDSAWIEITRTDSLIASGDTVYFEIHLNSTGLLDGLHQSRLLVSSNVPNIDSLFIPVTVNVTGQGELQAIDYPFVFDSTLVEESSDKTLRFVNVGTKEIIIENVGVIAQNEFSFANTPVLPISVQPTDTVNFSMRFSPLSSGLLIDTLLVETQTDTLYYKMEGVGLTPPEIAFNKFNVTGNYSADYEFVDTLLIFNRGLADLEFSIENDLPYLSFRTISGTVSSLDTAVIVFTISTLNLIADTYTGSFSIVSNDPFRAETFFPVSLHVSGFPHIDGFDFLELGDIVINTSSTVEYVIYNRGADTLIISDINLPINDVQILNADVPKLIPPKRTDTLFIAFTPTQIQSYNSVLSIISNDLPDSPWDVAVTGEGLPVPPKISLTSDIVLIETESGTDANGVFDIENIGGQDLDAQIYQAPGSGNAIFLDGDRDYLNVLINNSVAPSSQITIEAWIKPNVVTGIYSIVSKEGSSQSFNLKLDNRRISLYLNNSLILRTAAVMYASEWQHVAATYDGYSFKILRNGITVAEKYLPAVRISPNSENVRIGRSFNGEYFHGTIDEVRLWNVGRDASAIQKYADLSIAPNSDGLVLYFDFETKLNNVYTGKSSYANRGTAYGNVRDVKSEVMLNRFLLLSPSSAIIPGDDSREITVTARPLEVPAGLYSTPVEVFSNDPIDSVAMKYVQVTITGLPAAFVATDTIRFDRTYQTSVDTAFLLIENTGSDVLEVTGIAFDNSAFTGLDRISIPAFTRKRIPFWFSPELAQLYVGNVTLLTNDVANPEIIVALKGLGAEPPIISIDKLLLRDSTNYLIPHSNSFKIYNIGSGLLEYNLVVENADWITLDPSFGSVPVGDSVTVSAIYDPSFEGGLYETTVAVQSNALNKNFNAIDVSFRIFGAEIVLRPVPLYDTSTVGALETDTMFITNTGFEPLEYSLREYAYWLYLSKSAGVVLPNETDKVIVSYRSDLSPGTYSYSVVVNSNDVFTPVTSYPIYFTVLPPELIVSPDALFIGGILVGESKTGSIRLFNNSTASITIDSVLVGQPFSVNNYSGIVLLPGETRNIEIGLVATERTMYEAMAYIYTDEGREYGVPVSAEGILMPSAVSNMLPADSANNISQPVAFSWAPALNAKKYRLVIYNTDGDVLVSQNNITSITYTYTGNRLAYGETYTWRVVSLNYEYETEGPLQQFSLRELPDLVVSSITVPDIAFSGRQSQVEWQVSNIGIDRTVGNWYDYAYLSLDTILHTQFDIFLGGLNNVSYLEKDETYTQIHEFTLPNGISGNYYLLVQTNARNNIPELSTSNNLAVSDTTMFVDLTPPPDLRVFEVIAPDLVFSGEPTTVQWTIKNYGDGPTAETIWFDDIYISDNEEWNTGYVRQLASVRHNGILNNDSTYTGIATVTIPESLSGRYFIHVFTDSRSNVYEHAAEQNNTRASDSMQIILSPPPDLIVSQVDVSEDSASNNQTVEVQWVVENLGGTPTKHDWTDGIYIMPVGATHADEIIRIGSVRHRTALAIGEFRLMSANVVIPEGIKNNCYIYVRTDIDNNIDELNFEDNNTSSNEDFTVLYSDFMITSVMHADTVSSGDSVEISFYLRNNGTGMNAVKDVCISLGLSNRTVVDNTQQIFKTSCVLPNILAGDSVFVNVSCKLPDGVNGLKNLLITADYEQDIYEGDFENNTHLSTLAIVLNRWVDLFTDTIINQDTVKAGSQVIVEYAIVNQGNRDLQGEHFVNKIYLLQKDRIACGPESCGVLLKTEPKSYYLKADSVLVDSSFVTVPNTTPIGDYVFAIVLDSEEDIFEHIGENNNTQFGAVYVDKIPVDFDITSVTSNTSGWSGRSTPISWSVQNIGTVISNASTWYDNIYLSTDTVYDNADVQVGRNRQLNGRIQAGDSYTINSSAVLPNGIAGTYYLLVYADADRVTSDNDYSNNIELMRQIDGTPVSIEVALSPSPDLEVVSLNNHNTAVAGQPLSIEYTVENNGDASTDGYRWTDRFYLSRKSGDFEIDYHDIYLTGVTKTSNIAVGGLYTETVELNIPLSATGNYLLVAVADKDNDIYEHLAEDNNMLVSPISINLPPPSDLIVTDISAPASAIAGESITVEWNVQNIGNNPASGFKKDIVYFSLDTIVDENDVVFGIQTNWINLPPSSITNNSLTGRLLNAPVGDYNVIVKTDILNNINEVSDSNNTSVGLIPLFVDVKEIGAEDSVTDVLVNNIELYYKLVVDEDLSGETVLLTLYGDNINALNELYVKYNDMPSRSDHDLAYEDLFSGTQAIIIPELLVGTYYFLAIGNSVAADRQNVSLTTEIMEFEIQSLDPGHSGNTGQVTLKITGAKFTPDMDVMLQHNSVVLPQLESVDYTVWRMNVPADKIGDSISILVDSASIIKNIYINAGSRITDTAFANLKVYGPFADDTIVHLPLQFSGNYFIKIQYDTLVSGNLGLQINKPAGVTVTSRGYTYPEGLLVADAIHYVNSTLIFATFQLHNELTGLYDVHMFNQREIFTGKDLFTMENALAEDLQVRTVFPSSIRSNRSGSVRIEYMNTGNTDIANPVLRVSSFAGAPISETVEGLNERRAELQINLQHPREPINVLRPGAYGTKVIYFNSTRPISIGVDVE